MMHEGGEDRRAKRPFFTAEHEFLIENQIKASPKVNVEFLPKIILVGRDNNFLDQGAFEGKLASHLKSALRKKLKGNQNSFLALLDFGAISIDDEEDINYTKASFVSTIASTDYSKLGLLCFTLDSYNSVNYFYLAPMSCQNELWIINAFNQAKENLTVVSAMYITNDDLQLSSAQIGYQANYFITHGKFSTPDSDQGLESLPNLVKEYEELFRRCFYDTKTFSETLKGNAKYFLSMLFGFLIFQGGKYAESWMVMSRDAMLLKDSTLAITIMRVAILLSVRPLEAVTMLGAIAFGAKRHTEIGTIARAGWLAALTTAIVAIPILWTSELWLKNVFGQDPDLAQAAGDFLKIYCFSMPALTHSVADNNILFATDQPSIVALIELGTVVLGTGITYLFVFGKFGSEVEGLNGLAWSLVAQKWFNFILLKSYFFVNRNSRQYSLLEKNSASEIWAKFRLIFRKGLPLAFQIGSEQLYLFILTIYAGLLAKKTGGEELSQVNILFEYLTLFSITGALVMHKTVMQRVGEVRGRDLLLKKKQGDFKLICNNLGNVEKIMLANALISALYVVCIGLIFSFGEKPLVGVYIKSGEFTKSQITAIKDGLPSLLKIMAGATLTDQVRNLIGGALNGLGDVDTPMLTSTFLTVLGGGGLGALLTFSAGLGLEGALFSTIIAYALGGTALSGVLVNTLKTLKEKTHCDTVVEKGGYALSQCCCALLKSNVPPTGYSRLEDMPLSP